MTFNTLSTQGDIIAELESEGTRAKCGDWGWKGEGRNKSHSTEKENG